jgi:GNAT superfamily N-acetyltransferase
VSEIAIVPADDERLEEIARRHFGEESVALLLGMARSDRDGAWLALDESTPIGMCVAHDLEDERYVSPVVVEAGFRGQGIARELLARALGDTSSVRPSALIDIAQASAMAFALKSGLALRVPVTSVAGAIPHDDVLLELAGGMQHFGVKPLDPFAQSHALDAIDRLVRGSARPRDHQELFSLGSGSAFFVDDELIGYAYVRRDGRIGPLAAVAATYVAPLFAYSMAAIRREFGASWCTALIPGVDMRAIRLALRAALTVERSYVFAGDVAIGELECYVGGDPVLF